MESISSQRKLGPFTVSSIGLGCMNLSHAYGVPPSPEAATAVLLRAIDLGVTHFDTAALYGFGANEELVGRALAPMRSRFTLASKCGIQGVKSDAGMRRVIDGRPAHAQEDLRGQLAPAQNRCHRSLLLASLGQDGAHRGKRRRAEGFGGRREDPCHRSLGGVRGHVAARACRAPGVRGSE